ncbi:hypothetical protein AK830_g640 [Neonectria ditissima]|uniref:Uncharacterized protein n=1 Tax=Neonectria ditissima TaxID=78410 RepID=A0A0P7BY03_9HYPO|nr:hypothetical protein AK830_g640 [Neonectria ditissima]
MGRNNKPERSWGQFFLHIVGVGESRLLSVWFLVAILLGLIAKITVLISCMSPSTRSVYLFRVSADDLVNAATNATTASADALRIDGLPNHWYWGFSGVCAVHSGGDVSCKRSFPPTMTIEDMIAFAVATQRDEDASSAAVAKHIKPWTSALAQVDDDLTPASRPRSFFKAAVALTLISTILSFVLLPLGAVSLAGRLPRWILYAVAFVDALAFLAAGVLVIYAMDQGPRGLIQLSGIDQGNERTFVGPGFYVLFAGVLFTLISIGLFFCVAFCLVLFIIFIVMACMSSCCGSGSGNNNNVDYRDEHNTGGGGVSNGGGMDYKAREAYQEQNHPNYYSNANYYNTRK